jgi:inner membrane protein
MLYLFLVLNDNKLDHILNPIFIIIGSLFPDGDHKHAPMGKILPLWLICKHRGFTHSIQGMVGFTAIIGMFNLYWGLSFGIGYFTHLILDAMTPSGVKWWWKKKKTTVKWS